MFKKYRKDRTNRLVKLALAAMDESLSPAESSDIARLKAEHAEMLRAEHAEMYRFIINLGAVFPQIFKPRPDTTFFGGGHAPILRHYRSDDVRMAAEYLRQGVKDRTNAAIADELRNGMSGSEEKESSQIA